MSTGKTIALTVWTFVGKLISLLFNTLSRFLKAAILQQKLIKKKKRNPLARLSNEVLWEDVGKLTNQRENWNKHTNQDSGRTRNQKSSGQETTIIPARPHG